MVQFFEKCGSAPELEFSPLSMDSWRQVGSLSEEMLAVGDIGGLITTFKLAENPAEDKRSTDRWGLKRVWREKLHSDWVGRVRHVAEINSLLSCSLDCTICLIDVERRVPLKRFEGHTKVSKWHPISTCFSITRPNCMN